MTETKEEFGSLNPNAPKELERFAFLIGRWKGAGRTFNEDGSERPYELEWVGRYALDGHAIIDEARLLDEKGELDRVFLSFRFYDRAGERWISEVLDVRDSALTAQGQEEAGGVSFTDNSVTWMTRMGEMAGRETFRDIEADRFTYQMDVSSDGGATWNEAVDQIELRRLAG